MENDDCINQMSSLVEDLQKDYSSKSRKDDQISENALLEALRKLQNDQIVKEEPKVVKKEEVKVEIPEPVPVKAQAVIEPEKPKEPEMPKIDPEEMKAMGIKQAKEYELNYLKEHLDKVYKDTLHKSIDCALCKSDHIKGVRYMCIYCDGYNLCMKCEKLVDHGHPMLKFKTSDHFNQYKKDLLNKYPDILDLNDADPVNKVPEIVKIEEDKDQNNDNGVPKIINNISKSVFHPTYSNFDLLDFEDIGKYDVYTDDLLEQCKVTCLNTSPSDNHCISLNSSDICLTVSLKNDGKVNWPKGFTIKSLFSSEGTINVQLNEITIKPNEQILLDIFIKNPKAEGKYFYMFTLIDINGRKFGSEFSYAFAVKQRGNLFGGLNDYQGYGKLSSSCAY
jgi:hypothetical protein